MIMISDKPLRIPFGELLILSPGGQETEVDDRWSHSENEAKFSLFTPTDQMRSTLPRMVKVGGDTSVTTVAYNLRTLLCCKSALITSSNHYRVTANTLQFLLAVRMGVFKMCYLAFISVHLVLNSAFRLYLAGSSAEHLRSKAHVKETRSYPVATDQGVLLVLFIGVPIGCLGYGF